MIANKEAEQSVIGTILLEGDLIKDVTLRGDHFTDARHRLIYETMRKIDEAGESVNLVTVTTELNKRINQVGGVSYLSALAQSIPTTANVKQHQRLVMEAYRNRKTKEEAGRYISDPNGESLDTLMNRLEAYRSESLVEEEATTYDTLVEIANDMITPPAEGMTGFATGYKEVDDMTGGSQRGDLIILAGRPSMGKTAFALNLAAHHCQQQGSVHLFSLEMGRKSLLQRMLSAQGDINGQKWRSMNFSSTDYENCLTAMGKVASWQLHIHEHQQTVEGIRACVRESIRKTEETKPMIIIDYLQLMSPSGRYERRDLEIGAITRQLKLLARERNVPVILLSQLSRGVEQRKDKRPVMADLRESGNIEQDADVIGFLYREDYYNRHSEEKDEVEFSISKQRNGPVGNVRLQFRKEYGKFVELPIEEGELIG
ncbi:replicative DNA helicase [Halobacillus andaensis]|uniref:Replicative DNA helicase n=1 Tax=Halobacillus andaensis TaxID=1176239 RepID=A0A917B4E1_HALAA|nr:replicative DNA helicase [Halobacillus andaensis]MBP2004285.1 replicative DNA helicase [Halobacillus andaensis]GGF22858.1 replicative DNA helicase [Halobacillus andaensis]